MPKKLYFCSAVIITLIMNKQMKEILISTDQKLLFKYPVLHSKSSELVSDLFHWCD